MSSPPSISSTASTTVRFNVGGRLYEVSRSLLEQYPDTMLARLASGTWNGSGSNGDNPALFIERDGERFRYCLDYMRAGGNVVLPPTIPKDALLRELEYYGFRDIDTPKIRNAQENEKFTVLKISFDPKNTFPICNRAKDLCFDCHLENNSLETRYSTNDKRLQTFELLGTDIQLQTSQAYQALADVIPKMIKNGIKIRWSRNVPYDRRRPLFADPE